MKYILYTVCVFNTYLSEMPEQMFRILSSTPKFVAMSLLGECLLEKMFFARMIELKLSHLCLNRI